MSGSASSAPARRDGCPKRMVYGPCGGVRAGGRCEVDDRECPFVADPAPAWAPSSSGGSAVPAAGGRSATVPGVPAAPDSPESLAAPVVPPVPEAPADSAHQVPLVLCDFRSDEPTLAAVRALARRYAGWAGTVLLGEHHERVDLPNVLLAQVLQGEGLATWVTLTCRDRNSVALEADLAALAELGVAGVHCVTGDARGPHVRPGSTPVFDLDSLRLTELARRFGLTVSVAETPDAEPVDRRPGRAADKARAGASWCIVNTGVTPSALETFVGAVRDLGAGLRFAASIPVFTDAEGARRLQRLPGVGLDESAVRAVVGAPDPVRAGVERAAAAARDALRLDGVDGVNLSGPASTAGPVERADVLRAVMEEIT